jgi:hypothetical protein
MTLYYTYLVLIVISFLASLSVYIQKDNAIYFKVFPVFLLVTFLVEMIARQIGLTGGSNLWLYNIWSALEFGFYLYFFSAIYRNQSAKRTALYAMLGYLLVAFVNIFLIQGLKRFHTYTFMLGCVLVIAFGASYFFQLIRVPQAGKLSRNPAFWITAGLMIYYCCDLPVFGAMNYMTNLSRSTTNKLLVVYNFMNIILYSFFTVAFLCRMNLRKYTY